MKTSKRTSTVTHSASVPPRTTRIAFITLAMILPITVYAQLGNLAAMGDSLSDEYWDTGVSAYATNWAQLLVAYRGVDMGPTAAQAGVGTWGEPRNSGFKYNWSRGGANSAALLSQGQHTGVAGQAESNGVREAVLAIGANDFGWGVNGPYYNIYFGVWSAAQIQSHVAQSVSNIETALATLRTAGISLVLVNLIDPGPTPAMTSYYPNAANRDRVTAAIRSVNAGLKTLAQKYQVPLVDWSSLVTAMLGPISNLHSTLTVGNVAINLRASDAGPPNPRPANAFVSDGFHPNTVLQGIIANTILQAFNSGYGAGVPLFTEEELLNQALIPYGGSDTLQAQIGSFTNFVILPVPPRITLLTVASTSITLKFSTLSNQTYIVERRDDLVAGSWATASSNIAGTGGIVTLTNQVPADWPQRFYRARQLP